MIGNEDLCSITCATLEMKTNDEIYRIAEQSQNSYLIHHVMLNQMHLHCYFREYLAVVHLAEKYESTKKGKRALDFFPIFYEGLAALSLARCTKSKRWRHIGEQSVKKMDKIARCNSWNFENKLCLLKVSIESTS